MKKIITYILRWKEGFKDSLTVTHLQHAEIVLLKLLQLRAFPDEVKTLSTHDHLSKNTVIFRLFPFIDADGLIRV